MPITREWHIENRIILITLYSPISIEDIKDANQGAHAALDSTDGTQRIHSIFDMRSLPDKPANRIKLTELARLADVFKHPRLGWMIAISHHKFANFVFSIFNGVFNTRMRIFFTAEEAIAFLQEVDSTLPLIPPLRASVIALDDDTEDNTSQD